MKTLRFSGLNLSLVVLLAALLWAAPSFCPLTFVQANTLKSKPVATKSQVQEIIDAVQSATDKDASGIKVLAKRFGSDATKAALLAKLQELKGSASSDDSGSAAPATSESVVSDAVASAHPIVPAVAAGALAAAAASDAGKVAAAAGTARRTSAVASAVDTALRPVAAAAAAGVLPASDAVAAEIVKLEAALAASVATVAARDAAIEQRDKDLAVAVAARDAAVSEKDAAVAAAAAAAATAAGRIAALEAEVASITAEKEGLEEELNKYSLLFPASDGGLKNASGEVLVDNTGGIATAGQAIIDAAAATRV